MLHKKWIGIALLATAAVSTTASADNRGVNAALGAVVGAVIGNSVGGQDAAIIGGVLGAVVGASASGGHRDDRNYGRDQTHGYHQAQPYYQQRGYHQAQPHYQRQGYYHAQPYFQQQGYYQAQPYYQARAVSYRSAPVYATPVYRDDYSSRNDYRDYYQNDGYHGEYRGYDRRDYRR